MPISWTLATRVRVFVYKCTVSVLTAKATTFCNDAHFLHTFQLNVCIKEIVLGDLRPLFVNHTITRYSTS